MRSLFLTLAFLLLAGLCAGAAPLQAQSETDASLEAFLQELEAELERGEAERLIDPWFLKDIKALMVRHSWPWQTRIFADDFSADGPDPAPPWEVTAGEFLIDWRHGLRSRVVPARERQQSQSNEGAVAQLFGQIIIILQILIENQHLSSIYIGILKSTNTDPYNYPKSSRGRNTSYPAPPAQIPACATNALGSSLEYKRQDSNVGPNYSDLVDR